MVRGLTAGVLALVVAMALVFVGADRWLPAEAHGDTAIVSGFAGVWAGDADIAVNWTTARAEGASGGRSRRTRDWHDRRRGAARRLPRTEPDRHRPRAAREDGLDRPRHPRRRRRQGGRDPARTMTMPLNWIDDHFGQRPRLRQPFRRQGHHVARRPPAPARSRQN